MSGERALCSNCRFAGHYPAPDPLPEPATGSLLWGLIRWRRGGPTVSQRMFHAMHTEKAENEVPCFRYPGTERVLKTWFCGEHQPRENAS
jgi:hypothetical protein